MKVIPPVEINDITLTATNVAEPFTATAYDNTHTYGYGDLASESGNVYMSLRDSNLNNDPATSPLYWELAGVVEAAWASGTTYAAAATVYYKHRLYVSLQGTNLGKNPLTEPTYWEDVGPTNQYAMFDTERDTATIAASPLTCSITPGVRCGAIGFLGVAADSVRVQVTQLGATVYDTTVNLVTRLGIVDGYSYFFKAFTVKENAVLLDLPPLSNAVINLTFTRATGKVEVGAVVVGNAENLGAVQHGGAAGSMLNFSTIDNDTFGNSVLVKRRAVQEPKITTWLSADEIDNAIALREALNAEPALWVGIEDNASAFFNLYSVLGVWTQFDIGTPYENVAELNLVIKEI